MPEIHKTPLPGIGIRHEFDTDDGSRLGVITHHSGTKEILVYDRDDPDQCRNILRLAAQDAQALAEILGGSQVTEQLSNLQQTVEGLTIDWFQIKDADSAAGKTIGSMEMRSRIGVTIVAVIHEEEATAVPQAEFVLSVGDTVVVIGKPDGIKKAIEILRNG